MPVFIANRGNYQGADTDNENTFSYLLQAFNAGHLVVCDIQTYKSVLYFGHNEPKETVNWQFITKNKVICRAVDLDSFVVLYNLNAHCFWYQTDDMSLTSRGYLWCKPDVQIDHTRAIWTNVNKEKLHSRPDKIFGICGDIVI